jgi:DNA-binding transcriptional LysR family regulator
VNLRALRMFVATAEGGGLGRASARLHLSQPAASRQLHALEAELGVTLFHRSGRKLQLTPEGTDLLRQSHELLTAADLLVERARALKGGRTGTLKLGATPHVIEAVLAPFLRGHHSRHPGIEVQLVEGGATQHADRLGKGEVQLAIMPCGDERFDGRLLYPVHTVVVLPDTHRLGRRAVIDIAQLADESILLLHREFGSRRWFDAACEAAQFKPRVRLESAAPQALVELACVGYGVAVVPSTVVIRSEGVRVVPLVQGKSSIGRWSMLAWDPRRLLPEYARQFADELVAHSRRAYPGKAFTRRAPPFPRPKHPSE